MKVELISLNENAGTFLLKINDPKLNAEIIDYIHEDSPIWGDEHGYTEVNEYLAVETDSIPAAKRLSNEILEKFNKGETNEK